MTLKDFTELVTTMLTTQGLSRSEIFTEDIIREFNLFAPIARSQDIKQGNDERYAIEKTFNLPNPSAISTQFKKVKLDPPPENDLDPHQSIIRAIGYVTNNKIKDTPQTFSKDTLARINDKLYVAVNDVQNVASKSLTFLSDEVTYLVTGEQIETGQLVYVVQNGKYYRATQNFEASVDFTNDLSNLEQHYWMFVGDALVEPYYLPFRELRTSQVSHYTFSENSGDLYISNDIGFFHIWYIPDWVKIEKPEEKIPLSTSVILQTREQVVNSILRKLTTPQPQQVSDDE